MHQTVNAVQNCCSDYITIYGFITNYALNYFRSFNIKKQIFGLYLHSLRKHAGELYELLCFKSINAESQEGMFGQCHRIAESTTNRHPDNIITQIMIRMQCKHAMYETTRCSNTIVKKAAAGLPNFNGTSIPFEIVSKYKDS